MRDFSTFDLFDRLGRLVPSCCQEAGLCGGCVAVSAAHETFKWMSLEVEKFCLPRFQVIPAANL